MGGRFSSELGIDLSSGNPREIFKWFLASKLFGARISSNIAARTYREFEKCGVTSPEKILRAGWNTLVQILDDGGYARYDFSTATKLLEIMKDLKREYVGNLNLLHQKATDPSDLENRLMNLGKGIGIVTTNIFLRELRTVWKKAQPKPSPLVRLAAEHLGLLNKGKDPLQVLQGVWTANQIRRYDFCDFEAALVRLGKDYCKPFKCSICPMKKECSAYSLARARGRFKITNL